MMKFFPIRPISALHGMTVQSGALACKGLVLDSAAAGYRSFIFLALAEGWGQPSLPRAGHPHAQCR